VIVDPVHPPAGPIKPPGGIFNPPGGGVIVVDPPKNPPAPPAPPAPPPVVVNPPPVMVAPVSVGAAAPAAVEPVGCVYERSVRKLPGGGLQRVIIKVCPDDVVVQ